MHKWQHRHSDSYSNCSILYSCLVKQHQRLIIYLLFCSGRITKSFAYIKPRPADNVIPPRSRGGRYSIGMDGDVKCFKVMNWAQTEGHEPQKGLLGCYDIISQQGKWSWGGGILRGWVGDNSRIWHHQKGILVNLFIRVPNLTCCPSEGCMVECLPICRFSMPPQFTLAPNSGCCVIVEVLQKPPFPSPFPNPFPCQHPVIATHRS